MQCVLGFAEMHTRLRLFKKAFVAAQIYVRCLNKVIQQELV